MKLFILNSILLNINFSYFVSNFFFHCFSLYTLITLQVLSTLVVFIYICTYSFRLGTTYLAETENFLLKVP